MSVCIRLPLVGKNFYSQIREFLARYQARLVPGHFGWEGVFIETDFSILAALMLIIITMTGCSTGKETDSPSDSESSHKYRSLQSQQKFSRIILKA